MTDSLTHPLGESTTCSHGRLMSNQSRWILVSSGEGFPNEKIVPGASRLVGVE